MRSVVALRRATSWAPRPMLLTSSMFRSDSVVDPASAVVSATIVFWTTLIRRDSTDESQPSSGTVAKYTGAISQWTLKA